MSLQASRPNPTTSSLAACITAVSILVLSPSALRAISYDLEVIDFTGGHTLSGSIETDGTLGTLAPSNIIDLNIDVTGPYPYSIVSTADLSMSSVTATSTELFTTEFFAFDLYFTGAPCDPGKSCNVWLVWEDFAPVVEYRVRNLTDVSTLTHETFTPSGNPVLIGTAIPEPATLPLLLFGALFLARRRA